MTEGEEIRTLSPPKFIAEHWPRHLAERDQDLIEEFLDFVADSEHGGAELRCRVKPPTADPRSDWVWEEAPHSELLELFFAARENAGG